MNEPMHDAAVPPAVDVVNGKSAGTLLREAREAAGLHVGALAVSLKVPVKKLEALEADDLEQLPDAVFARALAATVCRSLKIDAEPVLARLPQLHTPPLQVGSQETPVRLDNRGGIRLPAFGGLPRSVVYLTAALLVGAIVVSMLPSFQLGGEPAAVGAPDGVAIRTVPNLVGGSIDVPANASTASAPMTGAEVAPAPDAAASAVATAASAALPLVAASAADGANAGNKVPVAAATDSGAIVEFNTRDASWVQVVDAAGLVHLRKTMNAGDTVRINNGTLPLSVVIGRANAIDVVVRGKPFDLAEVAKDNVARFQVK